MLLSRQRADIVLAVLVLACTIYLYGYTYSFLPPLLPGTPGPAIFPRMTLLIVAASAIGVGISALRSKAAPSDTQDDVGRLHLLRLAFIAVLGAAYGAFLNSLGFELATFAALAALLYVSTSRLGVSVVMALGGTLCFYVLFVLLLRVQAPTLFFPQYLSEIIRF